MDLNAEKQKLLLERRQLYIEKGQIIQRLQQHQGFASAELTNIYQQQLHTLDRTIQHVESMIVTIDNQLYSRPTYFGFYSDKKKRKK